MRVRDRGGMCGEEIFANDILNVSSMCRVFVFSNTYVPFIDGKHKINRHLIRQVPNTLQRVPDNPDIFNFTCKIRFLILYAKIIQGGASKVTFFPLYFIKRKNI